jgi:hypothetical protein
MNRRGRISVTLLVGLPWFVGEKGSADAGADMGFAGVKVHCWG